MTKKQRNIVTSWIAGGAVVVAVVANAAWVLAYWHILMWPVFALIVVLAARSNRALPDPAARAATLDLLSRYAWVKVYWFVYCAALAAGIFYVISHRVHVFDVIGVGGVLVVFLFLMLPVIILQQWAAYCAAGREGA